MRGNDVLSSCQNFEQILDIIFLLLRANIPEVYHKKHKNLSPAFLCLLNFKFTHYFALLKIHNFLLTNYFAFYGIIFL